MAQKWRGFVVDNHNADFFAFEYKFDQIDGGIALWPLKSDLRQAFGLNEIDDRHAFICTETGKFRGPDHHDHKVFKLSDVNDMLRGFTVTNSHHWAKEVYPHVPNYFIGPAGFLNDSWKNHILAALGSEIKEKAEAQGGFFRGIARAFGFGKA